MNKDFKHDENQIMIIVCPTCEKKYTIEEETLPDKGRRVRCGDCSHIWWQEPTRVLTAKPLQEDILEKESVFVQTESPLLRPEESLEKKRSGGFVAVMRTYYLDWLVIVFALVVVLFVIYRENETIFDSLPSIKQIGLPSSSQTVPMVSSGLMVQGIRYHTTYYNNTPHIIITGEIVNASTQALPVPTLTLTISGKNNGQEVPARSHLWLHDNQKQQLLPGERLPFQSMTTHPGWSIIDKIDVSY